GAGRRRGDHRRAGAGGRVVDRAGRAGRVHALPGRRADRLVGWAGVGAGGRIEDRPVRAGRRLAGAVGALRLAGRAAARAGGRVEHLPARTGHGHAGVAALAEPAGRRLRLLRAALVARARSVGGVADALAAGARRELLAEVGAVAVATAVVLSRQRLGRQP